MKRVRSIGVMSLGKVMGYSGLLLYGAILNLVLSWAGGRELEIE